MAGVCECAKVGNAFPCPFERDVGQDDTPRWVAVDRAGPGLLDFLYYTKYHPTMVPRTGIPRTGIKPLFPVRVDPEAAAKARAAAKASGKRVGVWLEEAISEKAERDSPAG